MFSKLISRLSKAVFSGEELGEDDLQSLYFITLSGTYGTIENAVNKGIKKKGKFGYFMSRIFPPYRFYKTAYPWAYKSVILIPIAWLMRLFRIIFKNPKRAANELKAIAKSDAKEEKEK